MKYAPRHNPLRNLNYKSKEQLGKHLSLTKYNPNEDKYKCTFCNKRFLTELGASNHVDFVHTELVLKALQEEQ